MDSLLQILALLSLLGAGTVGGVFFAFSSFVMRALAHLLPEQGIAAMQSINLRVLNPQFLGTFMGTALISLATVLLGSLRPEEPGATFFVTGGALYFVGTFMVTGLCNVPLNKNLAKLSPSDPTAADEWKSYVRRWTLWNHLRTAAALLAALALGIGLMQG